MSNREAVRKYREKNREKLNKKALEHYYSNKETILQKHKERRSKPEYRENYNEWAKLDRRRNPEKSLLRSCRKRASSSGLEFNLDLEDICIPEKCPILDRLLEYCGPDKRYWPSVDRIDNSKGYIKGNIKVISYKANVMKSDMLLWQVENLLNYMKGI